MLEQLTVYHPGMTGQEAKALSVELTFSIFMQSNMSDHLWQWKPLSVSLDYFKGCRKHPAHFEPAEDYDRTYHFHQCEEVVFFEGSKRLDAKKGDGDAYIPAGVSFSLKKGMLRL